MAVDPNTRRYVEGLRGREREVIERALANDALMDQLRESTASFKRGEKATPGAEVLREARSRRGGI